MTRTRLFKLSLAVGLSLSCSEQSVPTAVLEEPALGQSGAASLTSVVVDPSGDAAFRGNSGSGSDKKVPDWLDITRSEISKQGRTFVLTMNLADLLPAAPPEASGGLGLYQWGWGLDTDTGTSPAGTPFPKSDTNPFEFFVLLDWNGTAYQASVMDRRPLLSGGEALFTRVAATVDGATIRLSVSEALLGNPSAFSWGAFTDLRHAHYGNEGFDLLDVAPDLTLATWPE
jgi:hypothetical protein